MDGLVLKHSIGHIEHLSFLSPPHMSLKETITLPFNDFDDQTGGTCCRGLFFLDNFDGKSAICNLTTRELKLLTPPHPDHVDCDTGLGYDPISDDYKVIRNHNPASTAEVYSLKSDSWKLITGPGYDIDMGPRCGLYLEGRCYWIVMSYAPEVGVRDFILSFDFTRETFSRFPLPPALRPPRPPGTPPPRIKYKVDLFDCDGSLGVVGYKRLEDHKSRLAKHFELWVCKCRGGASSWARSFSVILLDVERPLGLRGGRFLFLEGNGESSCGHSHLMVYDWVKEELREYDIYAIPPISLLLLSYVENRVVLPDAKPLINGLSAQEKVLKRCRHRVKVDNVEHSPEKVLKRCRHRVKVDNVEHSPEKVLKRCRHREVDNVEHLPEKVHVQHSPENVLKKCRRPQEKTLKNCGPSTSGPASQQS
ncbi:hypothetical protein OROMI_010966 [Orobanche minor]